VGTGRPILAVGPETGDVARVLDQAPHAVINRPSLMDGKDRIKALFTATSTLPDRRWSRTQTCVQVAEALNTL
jgi:hypothetical protein